MTAAKIRISELLSQKRPFNRDESAGLFLGINEFRIGDIVSNEFAPLRYAVDDAIDMAYLFICEFELIPPENAIVAISGSTTKNLTEKHKNELEKLKVQFLKPDFPNIETFIEKTSNKSGENGYLVYSFSSHGYLVEGRNYIVCTNTVTKRREFALPLDFVMGEAAKSPTFSLIFVDACRIHMQRNKAGILLGKEVEYDRFDTGKIDISSGCFGLCSGVDGSYSYENDEKKNGVFTAALIDGLKGAADHVDGFITPKTLTDYVNQSVKQWFKLSELNEIETSAVKKIIDADMDSQPILPKLNLATSDVEEELRIALIEELKMEVDSLATDLCIDTARSIGMRIDAFTLEEGKALKQQIEFFRKIGKPYSDTFDLWWRNYCKLDQDKLAICSGFSNIIHKIEELIDNSDKSTLELVIFSPKFGSLHSKNDDVARHHRISNRGSYAEAVDRVWEKLSANVKQIIILDPQDKDGLDSPLKTQALKMFTDRAGYRNLDIDQIAQEALTNAREILSKSSNPEVCFIKELPLQLLIARLSRAEGQTLESYGCMLLMVASGNGLVRLKPGDEIGIYFVIDAETKRTFEAWIESLEAYIFRE